MLHKNISTVAQNGQSKATIKDSEAKDVQLVATCNYTLYLPSLSAKYHQQH